MQNTLNVFTKKLDYYQAGFLGIYALAPANPVDGNMYINSGDNGLYIYYGSSWQLLHTLTPPTLSFLLLEDNSYLLLEDGVSKLVLE